MRKIISKNTLRKWSLPLGLLLAANPARSQDGTWNADAADNWSTSSRWLGGIVAGAATPGSATFGNAITSSRVITLDINVQLTALNFTNAFSSGGYTINATGANAITFSAGASITNGALGISNVSAPATLSGNLTISGSGAGNLVLGGVIGESAPSQIVLNAPSFYNEAGVVTLSAANTFSGGVNLLGGNLRIGNANALGMGTLIITGASGTLSASTGSLTIPNAVNLSANLVFAGGNDLTIGGIISGSGFGVQNRSRGVALTLTNNNTYSGPTTVTRATIDNGSTQAGAGSIVLLNNGQSLNTSAVNVDSGGTFRLNNSGGATSFSRIGTIPINLVNGTYRVTGSTAAAGSFAQAAGALTGLGFNTLVADSNSATSEGVDATFPTLSRGAAGTGTFLFLSRGNNLGTGPAGVDVQRFLFTTTAPAPVGAGPLGSPSAGILPYALAGLATNSTGLGFATYDTNGIRLLTAAESATSLTAGTNVSLTAAVTAQNTDFTIQSLAFSGGAGIAGNFTGVRGQATLTVTSGGVFAGGSLTYTVSNNLNFNGQEAVFSVTQGTNLGIGGTVSGTGGLTKSGTGVLTLANPFSSYSGTTTINDGYIAFSDVGGFGTSSTAIQVYGRGGAEQTGVSQTGNPFAVNFSRNVAVNSGVFTLNNQAATRPVLVVSGTISGIGGVVFRNQGSGFGAAYVTGTNTYTGETRLSAGTTFLATDANFGTGGPLFIGGAAAPTLFLANNWSTARQIDINLSGSVLQTGAFNATWNGVLTGSGNWTKLGTGTVTLTNAGNTAVGAVTLGGGTLALSNAGTLNAVSQFNVGNGTLLLDNTGSSTINERIGSNANLSAGGQFGQLIVRTSGAGAVSQRLGIINLDGGGGGLAIRLDRSGGTGSIALTAASLGFANQPSFVVTGDDLANASTGTFTTSIRFNTAPTLIGTGTLGSTTAPILPGGFGSRSTSGSGVDFLTYDPVQGVRMLTAGEYAATQTVGTQDNVKLAAAGTFATGTINSLSLNGFSASIAGGNTLTIASGLVLSTAGNVTLGGNGGIVTGSTFGANSTSVTLNAAAGSSLTTNAAITGTTRVIKLGGGDWILDARNAGGTSVAAFSVNDLRIYEGRVIVPSSVTANTAFPTGNTTVHFANGSILDIQSTSTTTNGLNFNVLGGGGTVRLSAANGLVRFAPGTTFVNAVGLGELTLDSGSGQMTFETASASTGNALVRLKSGTYIIGQAVTTMFGNGLLTLESGVTLAPRAPTAAVTRSIATSTVLLGNLNFINRVTLNGLAADDANFSNFTISGPMRLDADAVITNSMAANSTTAGVLTFSHSIFDNPYGPARNLSLVGVSGGGRILLTSPNVYRGNTVIDNATVVISNATGSAFGTGNVTVNANAALLGGNTAGTAGFIRPAPGGSVTVNGSLFPTGFVTIGSPERAVTVSLTAASRYTFSTSAGNVGSPTPISDGSSTTTAGTTNNILRIQGNASAVINFNPGTVVVDSGVALANWNNANYFSWILAQTPTGATVNITQPTIFDATTFIAAGNTLGTGTFSIGTATNAIVLNFSPVPEPASLLALCGLAGGLYFRRRRNSEK